MNDSAPLCMFLTICTDLIYRVPLIPIYPLMMIFHKQGREGAS